MNRLTRPRRMQTGNQRSGFASMIVLVAITIVSISLTMVVGAFAQRTRFQRSAHASYQAESIWRIAADLADLTQPVDPLQLDLSPASAQGETWTALVKPDGEGSFQITAKIRRGDRVLATVNRKISRGAINVSNE